MAMLLLVLQTVALIAAMALLGQFVVAIFNWRARHENIVYQLFGIVAKPIVRVLRFVTPRVILDQHVPAVAFLLLVIGYVAIGLWHRDVCRADVAQRGCERWAQAWQGAQQ